MVKTINTKISVECYHCGNICTDDDIRIEDKAFCCAGCKTVYEILQDNNLCGYYDLNENAGVSLKAKNFEGKYDYLDSEEIVRQLLSFKSETLAKITLYIPSVHCSSCVWLLENFQKVRSGVLTSRLNFMKKELSLSYNPTEVSLKEIVELLATLGYAPLINLESPESTKKDKSEQRKLLLKIGVTGFAFGNMMLLSLPEYFMDYKKDQDPGYQTFFLYLNLLLAMPVYFYGASDYLKGAFISIRENLKKTTNILSVDIPIAIGVSALFFRSVYETLVNHSSGYWDSLGGLVLFLLAGKFLQQVTYNYLSFERDYKSYFPLAAKVKDAGYKNVSDLKKSDIIEIHHQELIPADSILLSEQSLIDYGFVTGESAPIKVVKGEEVFAGGRQLGEKAEFLVQKEVSQSYLTGLWNDEVFNEAKESKVSRFANIFVRYFTYITLAVAALTGLYWYFNDPGLIWITVTAVLIIACPCALTLAMPFAMNTAMVTLGKGKFFVKNQNVIQLLTEIDTIAFDKTGTLTEGKSGNVIFKDGELSEKEVALVVAVTAQSVHPLSKLITAHLSEHISEAEINDFKELKGMGLAAEVNGHQVRLGSSDFLGVNLREAESGQVLIEIDGKYKGRFITKANYREGWQDTLNTLAKDYLLSLISGDNEKDKEKLQPYFNEDEIRFNLKPQDKLDFVKAKEQTGNKVLMVGDGLNDAGALSQAHVGVALSEDVNAFSPSCDVILDAGKFNRINDFIRYSKTSMNVVRASFVLSMVYNVIGVGLAMAGYLKPVVAAIFMPFSSITTVLFAVGLTYLYGKTRKIAD